MTECTKQYSLSFMHEAHEAWVTDPDRSPPPLARLGPIARASFTRAFRPGLHSAAAGAAGSCRRDRKLPPARPGSGGRRWTRR